MFFDSALMRIDFTSMLTKLLQCCSQIDEFMQDLDFLSELNKYVNKMIVFFLGVEIENKLKFHSHIT